MTTAPSAVSGGCSGDSCDGRLPWPLHYIRHRGSFRRLCTSCLLKTLAGSFCTSCFSVLDSDNSSSSAALRLALVHCSKCPSVSHLACLPNPDLAPQFVCPPCQNPQNFSFFPPGEDSRKLVLKLESAKVLLAAAKLASANLNRAALSARLEAERKSKEAVVARKRARDLLQGLLLGSREEARLGGSGVENGDSGSAPLSEVVDARKKVLKHNVSPGEIAAKRVQSREREKWMRFNELVGAVGSPAQESDKNNSGGVCNRMEQEKDGKNNGAASGLQIIAVKKE